MDVSAVSGNSGYQSPETQAVERQVLALKKQQDAQTAQAEGLIALIQQAAPQGPPSGKDGVGTLISVYA
jgi:hypothetical protein